MSILKTSGFNLAFMVVWVEMYGLGYIFFVCNLGCSLKNKIFIEK
jgi:hypothetical protein